MLILDKKIRIQFLGAIGTVTGSRILLETENTKVYIDAGLYQGAGYIEERNYLPLDIDSKTIDAIFLTHAHIDHSGLVPKIIQGGFDGIIFCAKPTGDILDISLRDAAKIVEDEFKSLSKTKKQNLNIIGPIFTNSDVVKTLSYIQQVDYNIQFVFQDIKFTYYWSGHILGSAHLLIECYGKTFLFSGDIAPFSSFLHQRGVVPPSANYIIIESTYGLNNRKNDNYEDKLIALTKYCLSKKGMLIIPAFAIGRTQVILYVLYLLITSNKIPNIPIYLDSPMAIRITKMYMQYPLQMNEEVRNSGFLDFLNSDHVHFTESVADSKKIMDIMGPGIIISASGMCHGGRVMLHLAKRISNGRNALFFIGYQAEGSVGRDIIERKTRIKIHGQEYQVRAEIDSTNIFSAHADQTDLKRWVKQLDKDMIQNIFIVHGTDEARIALKEELSFIDANKIKLPKMEQSYYL